MVRLIVLEGRPYPFIARNRCESTCDLKKQNLALGLLVYISVLKHNLIVFQPYPVAVCGRKVKNSE